MIQRIQSVYLFLTTLLSLLFLRASFLTFVDKSGSIIKVSFTGILSSKSGGAFELIEKTIPITVLVVLISIVSVIAIFLYKNRKVQLSFSLAAIILTCLLIATSLYYCLHIIKVYQCEIVPGFSMLIPVLILISSFLAYRGIKKDDLLVKSYDRLR
jgi:hypothetical protein